ncbi:hypothetical protein GLW08_03825 [Pontibacillus yanchengensis]|uniref:Uncharacterized protein n=2 Tax=Pontibacillus yanchengensis TaxID=462910 RepID=A0ACC7VEA2_9BACI|nr:hypothetical protein [Pontibacillus yanchengensis]MYL35168.1 hypothetical protein [Pontibacillus yanchengensis]MYL52465.1 hypothetical protein [Pontibacillus yanchengensis]
MIKQLGIIMVGCFLIISSNAGVGYSMPDKIPSNLDFSEVTFMNSETKRDVDIEKAFSEIYDVKPGDNIRYYYNRIDLNDDHNPETFVLLVGPYVCGTGGCSALILQKVDKQYKVISKFSLVRNPIIIRDKMTNGWNNILMYVAGGGEEPSYRELIFDGKTYPSNPSVQTKIENEEISGVGIINDDLAKSKGITY